EELVELLAGDASVFGQHRPDERRVGLDRVVEGVGEPANGLVAAYLLVHRRCRAPRPSHRDPRRKGIGHAAEPSGLRPTLRDPSPTSPATAPSTREPPTASGSGPRDADSTVTPAANATAKASSDGRTSSRNAPRP